MEDIQAANKLFYLHIALMDVSVSLNIVLSREWLAILRCRPETYYYHLYCVSFPRTLGRDYTSTAQSKR